MAIAPVASGSPKPTDSAASNNPANPAEDSVSTSRISTSDG